MVKHETGLRRILWAMLLLLILLIHPLYTHNSQPAIILGRYSNSYALVLVVHALNLAITVLGLFFYKKLSSFLLLLHDRVLFIASLCIIIIGTIFTQLNLENQTKTLGVVLSLGFIWMLAISVKREHPFPVVFKVLLFAIVLLIPLQFLYAISVQAYMPDEAGWAERALNLYRVGGIYKSTRLQTPFLITPGYGWFLALYGWILHNVWFSVVVGRIWIFVFNLAAVLGVGLLTWRLYGRQAAWLSMGFASLSSFVFFTYDFKANFQLKAIVTFMILAASQARLSPKYRYFWHFMSGLIATLALEFHASAIAYPIGLTFVYLAEYLYQSYQARRLGDLRPLIFFGLGGAIGTGFYFVFNILSIGGIEIYLSHLSENRFQAVPIDYLRLLRWPFLLEILLIALSFIFIAWRHNRSDRLFFLFLIPIICINYFIDKFGYTSSYQMLYFVPFGVFVLEALPIQKQAVTKQIIVLSLGIFGMALALDTLESNDSMWQMLRSGQLPRTIYERAGDVLRPQLRPDDVIVSEADLIWGLPEYHNQILSYGIPVQNYERLGYASADEIWPSLAPTVFVDTPRITLLPELEDYIVSNGFRLCESYPNLISIYRPDCDGEIYQGNQ